MKKVVIAAACAAVLFGAGDDAKKLQDACDSGDTRSCYNLGVSYANGQDGAEQDYKKASELFLKACEAKDAKGCYNLGILYSNGQGVKQDIKKAVELFFKACENGRYQRLLQSWLFVRKR